MKYSKLTVAFSIVAILVAALSSPIKADEKFRNHRFDSFRACPLTEESIVFFGNSITNMHEWKEAFGNDPRIINRGTSGALTQELLDNADCVIDMHPAKVFILIGTNDLGTEGLNSPAQIADNIRILVRRFQLESPQTEIYVQSILPSEVGLRTLDAERETNELIRQMCEKTGVTYIDLFDDLLPITDRTYSYDGLHLTADAYRLWCRKIAPYVGVDCTYPENFTPDDGGMKGSYGMRATYWSAYPVEAEDILFIGDEMVHGGEWHELLGNPNVKNRGTGWGYGGLSLNQWAKNMKTILHSNEEIKSAPSHILLYVGVNVANGKTPLERIDSLYRNVIDSIRMYAPAEKTRLTLLSLIPRLDIKTNKDRIEPVNEIIQRISSESANTDFINIYTTLSTDAVADPLCIKDDYLYSEGYKRVANAIKMSLNKKNEEIE